MSKRLLDVLLGGALLVAVSPLMLLLAAAIALDSPGSPIFRQVRIGLRRRARSQPRTWDVGTFTLYKFRTMRTGTDSSVHQAFMNALIHDDREGMSKLQGGVCALHKLANDSRITRVGRLLRKYSLDELPQLWNVLKGDMSLVGPRPPLPYEVDIYEAWHRQRLEAIPGMTGLWQVTARSNASFDEMVGLDLQYIEQWSPWLDLEILLKTPWAVLRGKGAV